MQETRPTKLQNGFWKCQSQSQPGKSYTVRVEYGFLTCDCPAMTRGYKLSCKHCESVAAEIRLEQVAVPFWNAVIAAQLAEQRAIQIS